MSTLKHISLTAILLSACLFQLQAQKDSLQGIKSQATKKKDTLKPVKIQPPLKKNLFLKIVNMDSASTKDFKMPDYSKAFANSKERLQEIQKLVGTLHDESYLTATVDSMFQDSTKLIAFLHPGKPYKWACLRKGNVAEVALNLSGYRDKIFRKKPFYFKVAAKLMDNILRFYENHGYPFAKVKLDSIQINGNTISAALKAEKENSETIDSIVIKGNLKLSAQYLYGYLGIKPGDLYDESKVAAISGRMKALPFLMETKPMQVLFIKDKVKLLLYLSKKNANQFNGIIGILPNSAGKVTVTGDIALQLQNTFHRDDEIGFHWQHLQPLTENLTINFSYPYLFETPIGIDEKFKLFKQDTTYLQLDNRFGFKYLFIGGNYLEVYYENIITNLLSTTVLQSLTGPPPPYTDGTTDLYGIEYKVRNLDYIYNPRRGYDLLGSVAVGQNSIRENSAVNPEIYEGLALSSIEYRGTLTGDYYIPVGGRSAIKFEVNGGYIQDPSLLLNDLFRIGGLEVLRGFNEQSLYVSQYAVGTIEFHYLLEQNSFLFIFYDQGWVRETLASYIQYFDDTPAGFGAGMDFQTKAGIFSFSYALGNGIGNPLNFSTGKINFGIVNYF